MWETVYRFLAVDLRVCEQRVGKTDGAVSFERAWVDSQGSMEMLYDK